MRVILLEDVRGIGHRDEVREVKDGYARNFLIAKGLARQADEQSIKGLEVRKTIEEETISETKERLRVFAHDLKKKALIFKVAAGPKGEVFESIGGKDIMEKIKKSSENKKDLEKIEVLLLRPLKSLGEHSVRVNYGRGIEEVLMVILESNESR